MIRFSAVLVTAAIGVLVAGIATSKLLLVYVAIAASAAALVALAIGVVLKREELFATDQRLEPEPARAGAVPGASVSGQAQPALATANAGWAANVQGAGSLGAGTPGGSSAPGRPGAPWREPAVSAASQASPWEPWTEREQPAQGGPWRPAAAWLDPAASQASRSDAERSGLPQGSVPGGRVSDWDTPDASGAGYAGPRPGTGSPPGRPGGDVPSRPDPRQASPRSWQDQPWEDPRPVPPSWFDRTADPLGDGAQRRGTPGRHASPDTPVPGDFDSGTRGGTATPKTSSGWSWPPRDEDSDPAPASPAPASTAAADKETTGPDGDAVSATRIESSLSATTRLEPAAPATRAEPAQAGPAPAAEADDSSDLASLPGDTGGAADDDDDWPTRYSWLDDDPEPDEETTPAVTSAVAAPAADEPEADPSATRPTPTALLTSVPPPPPVAAGVAATDTDAPWSTGTSPGLGGAWKTGATEDTHADEHATAGDGDTDRDTTGRGESPAAPEPAATAQADEPPTEASASSDTDSALVTVVPGVPRYHEQDCILIRFMPEKDIQKLAIPDAKANGCTPCAACQPAE